MRYFVRAPISGWREVTKEQYERFVSRMRAHATPTVPIEELIRARTRIEEEPRESGAASLPPSASPPSDEGGEADGSKAQNGTADFRNLLIPEPVRGSRASDLQARRVCSLCLRFCVFFGG